ncbi:MAG: hypothetical protein D6785_06265, partial [Planctomycetota bacterium]
SSFSPLVLLLFFGFFWILPLSLQGDALTQPKKDLIRSLRSRNEEGVKKAIAQFLQVGGKKAVSILLKLAKRFPRGEEKLYWMLLHGATSFQDEGAMEEMAKFILENKRKGFSRDILFALAQNDSDSVLIVHRAVLLKGPYDLQLMSVDQIAHIRNPKSVDILLECWKKVHKKKHTQTLQKRIARSLSALTGETMGEVYENWKGWWEQNRSRGLNPHKKRKTTGTIVDRLGYNQGSEFEELKKIPKDKILVIQGSPCRVKGVDHNFDHIEETLSSLGIPHTVVTKREFNVPTYSLKGKICVIINCSLSWGHCVCPKCKPGGTQSQRLMQCTGCDKHIIVEDKITQAGIEKLKNFVLRGGYLFTEDWVLVEVLAKAWPNMVVKGKPTRDEYYVNIVPGKFQGSHNYLRGVFGFKKKEASSSAPTGKTVLRGLEEALKKVKHNWKIDKESPSIKIKSPYKVTKLLVSPELGKKTGGNDSVAVTFAVVPRGKRAVTGRNYGEISEMRGGRVLHVISHFGKQKSSDDEYTIQNLLVNFLIEAKQRWDFRK